MTKVAFFVTARNKAQYVARAVKSALAQTYPCEILLSDQHSTDGTLDVIERTVAEAYEARGRTPFAHIVRVLRCPIEGEYGMRAANAHTLWAMAQTDAEWVFQCSADDYSLPDRVAVCMREAEKLKREGKTCAAIACTMYFTEPGEEVAPNTPHLKTESGYVSPGFGLVNLLYGSTIQGWRRDWFLKIGSAQEVTGDVYHGFMAAHEGYYVVASPQHVHVKHASLDNMGFEGKMRAAAAAGDESERHHINELNRFQLFGLYMRCAEAQQKFYPLAHQDDRNACLNMLIGQACGWYAERLNLHARSITPGVIPA